MIARYIGRRLALALLVLTGASILSFSLAHVVPGDPAAAMLGPFGTPERVAALRAELGLDKPLPVQYVEYVRRLGRGDLGTSYRTGNPVTEDIRTRWPATLELTVFAMALSVLVGIPLGIAAAVKKDSMFDYLCSLLGVAGVSVPVFWTGLVLSLIFFAELRWAPAPLGRISLDIEPPTHVTGLYVLDSLLTRNWPALVSSLHHLILPVVALALPILAPMTRMTRSAMVEALSSDYVRAARILGLPGRYVVFRMALRNALIPVITMVGIFLGYQVSGSVLVETVFSWPGLGLYITKSIIGLDYQPVLSLVLVIGVVFVGVNLVVDLVYLLIDPRIRVA